ncbi:hypothetical protein M569_08646 [Genlisea aurea]|uniref:Protein kinase domain-containing protein n=1 Tax=Genlisea aurea TaxID=192259 RepID=S8CMW0_9LAMI|nr:hypothetical protein M569_08646 [Genlisea aurea]
MDDSPDSRWQMPDDSRGFNSSFLDRNQRFFRENTVGSSEGIACYDSGVASIGKRRGRPSWQHFRGENVSDEETGVSIFGLEDCNDVSLRQWLDDPDRSVNATECIHIFSQIVDVVNVAHSEGIVIHNVRPSCFVMSSCNRVSFIESASSSDSGSGGGGGSSPVADEPLCDQHSQDKVVVLESRDKTAPDSQINSDTSCLQSGSGLQALGYEGVDFPMKQILIMESNWYALLDDDSSGFSSDVYQLGVLLFELFCSFSSMEEKISAMENLRHRILPPNLLLKWPKEASFCLWLLHPDPSCRPKTRRVFNFVDVAFFCTVLVAFDDLCVILIPCSVFYQKKNNNSEILKSEFLTEPRSEMEEREAAIELREKIEEHELLLEFLLLLQRRKQDDADTLNEIVSIVHSDVAEVTKRRADVKMKSGDSFEPDDDSSCRKRIRNMLDNEATTGPSARLMSNFRKFESAYFMKRINAVKQTSRMHSRNSQLAMTNERSSGWIDTFLDGLCKYLNYNKLELKADLKQRDLLNSSNLVCSLSFDRDGEFLATAGVNKKIKVFEYDSILNGDRDIHYPVVEMAGKSKLSSICWNSYIKSHIASSNFEGVVQVWDVTRSRTFVEMKEHEKRVWSVDFSIADPTMLASGSDDGSAKLWNINQAMLFSHQTKRTKSFKSQFVASVSTIKTKANVCCVQFRKDSCRNIAFGSADHKIYYYDLRNPKVPLCTLVGHTKTVSYVKFIDSTTLVSASTDNSMKLWDLSLCTSRILDCPVQSFTGHLNLKNFVGLTVSEGYIATGSESNAVYVYHKAFPMPALSYKFSDPVSDDETEDSSRFISSVCWRAQSSTLLAANSMGNIKILEMGTVVW